MIDVALGRDPVSNQRSDQDQCFSMCHWLRWRLVTLLSMTRIDAYGFDAINGLAEAIQFPFVSPRQLVQAFFASYILGNDIKNIVKCSPALVRSKHCQSLPDSIMRIGEGYHLFFSGQCSRLRLTIGVHHNRTDVHRCSDFPRLNRYVYITVAVVMNAHDTIA